MSDILQAINKLNSFYQTLIASAVFASILWLGRKIFVFVVSWNKDAKRKRDINFIHRHWIYKNYVQSANPSLVLHGYLYVISKSLFYTTAALLMFTFYFGVTGLLDGDISRFIFAYFTFMVLWTSRAWLIDHSSDEFITGIDSKLVEEVSQRLNAQVRKSDQSPENQSPKNQSPKNQSPKNQSAKD